MKYKFALWSSTFGLLIRGLRIIVLSAVCCACLKPHVASASLYSSLHLPDLEEKSELIVKGRVLKVEKSADGNYKAKLSVDGILKGEWNETEMEIAFLAKKVMGPILDDVKTDDYALFFLSENRTPTDPYHLKLRIREGNAVTPPPDANPLSRIKSELLFSSQVAQESKENKQLREETEIAFESIQQLAYFSEDDEILDALQKIVESNNQNLRGAAIIVLLNFSQASVVKPALDYIELEVTGANERDKTTRNNVRIEAVITALGNVSDTEAVEGMGKLLDNPNILIRRAAIRALRQMARGINTRKTKGTTILLKAPDKAQALKRNSRVFFYLVHALDDTDSTTRTQAVWALSHAAFQPEWYPAYSIDKKPAQYHSESVVIEHWRNWWKQQEISKPQ